MKPISRDDYVPAGGATGSNIREMTPRASGMASRSKAKAKSALPAVAVPPPMAAVKPKKEKKEKVAAQKPDLKLTAEVLENQSPLAAHLKKHTEKKKIFAPYNIWLRICCPMKCVTSRPLDMTELNLIM